MSIFHSIKYPIGDVFSYNEVESVPNEILFAWIKEVIADEEDFKKRYSMRAVEQLLNSDKNFCITYAYLSIVNRTDLDLIKMDELTGYYIRRLRQLIQEYDGPI